MEDGSSYHEDSTLKNKMVRGSVEKMGRQEVRYGGRSTTWCTFSFSFSLNLIFHTAAQPK